MRSLAVTLIDVGCGDSILVESTDDRGGEYFALVDCNDTINQRSSFTFLKRHFEKKGVPVGDGHLFDLVLLTHEHADHAQGLKQVLREFGAKRFLYPESVSGSPYAHLLGFAQRSTRVRHHEPIDASKRIPNLGDATIKVLWPPRGLIESNPNNNSVVLLVRLGSVSVILTGDAEERVWARIASQIPVDTKFFKVPHHGSENGTFDSSGGTLWLSHCPSDATLALSTHVVPHKLPDESVLNAFYVNERQCLRTDRHYHIRFETDGVNHSLRYTID